MKLLYVGSKDFLAVSMIEKFKKEDYEVAVISDQKLLASTDPARKHQFYQYTVNPVTLENIVASVKPDVIVFAGLYYLKETWKDENEDYLTVLRIMLSLSQKYHVAKFIYLSSLEVLGVVSDYANEDSKMAPVTKKGTLLAQGEYLAGLYRETFQLPVTIIRASWIFDTECRSGNTDFLSRLFWSVEKEEITSISPNEVFQPIYIGDFLEAVKRVAEFGQGELYHVASSSSITYREIRNWIERVLGRTGSEKKGLDTEQKGKSLVQCQIIKDELEWVDFYSLEQLFQESKIKYVKSEQKTKNKREGFSVPLRKTAENLFIFLILFTLYSVSREHPLFSQIPWLLIYVVVIALYYGVQQSLFSIVLASGAYLIVSGLSIFRMVNFYSYAEASLAVITFVFFGILISYQFSSLREKVRETQRNNEMLSEELTELKNVNLENVQIKEEYEKRILESRTGITKLYETVSRLLILQPERIFSELMNVIHELLETETVAVYKMYPNSGYLRLIHALSEDSVMDGKSWNLYNYPSILNAIKYGEIYIGNVWENEPAYVIPIDRGNDILAVIVIKSVSFEKQSLYFLNIMRTLRMLIVDVTEEALAYEDARRAERYDEVNGWLKWEAFLEMIEIAEEKKTNKIAEYCLLKMEGQITGSQVDDILSSLRMTDYIGSDGNGGVYILLSNSNKQESGTVIERMKGKGYQISPANELKGA